MKSLFSFLTILLAAGYCNGQGIPSSCTAPDSIKAQYFTDAQGLALDRIFQISSVYTDSVKIPSHCTDSMMRPLLAVYNATSLPERDSVVSLYRIHCYHYGALKSCAIKADKTLPWVVDLKHGTIPTGNAAINTIMAKYHLHLSYYTEMGEALIFLQSDSNINRTALVNEWNAISPVHTDPYMNAMVGDGPGIYADTVTPEYTLLRYVFRCGDCPSGCIYSRTWKFRVTSNCIVTYLGSTGSDLSEADCAPPPPPPTAAVTTTARREIGVFPNPFFDKISLTNVTEKVSYKVVSVTGAVMCYGEVDKDGDVSLTNLAPGMYWLNLYAPDYNRTIKIIRQ